VAPVAPHSANVEKNRLVLLLRPLKGLIRPINPMYL
jgi:hypothetical protein